MPADVVATLIEGLYAIHGLLLSITCNVFGWWLVIDAVQKIVKSTRRSSVEMSLTGQSVRLSIGALLTQVASFLEEIVQGLTGAAMDKAGPMSVNPVVGSSHILDMIHFGFLAIFVVGVASIIWGARLWARAADGAGQGARTDTSPAIVGTVHIVFGAIGINAWRWAGYLT